MGLAEVQALMARLYTDEPLRGRFFEDPNAVGREPDLAANELAQVVKLAERQVAFFASTLIHKRLNAVAGLLPETREVLGDRFHALFERYAGSYAPSGVRKYRDDALSFASYLVDLARVEPLEPDSAVDQLRYEAAWIRATQPGVCCLVRLFRHSPTTRRGLTHRSGSERPGIALWLRFTPRGRLRHGVWAL